MIFKSQIKTYEKSAQIKADFFYVTVGFLSIIIFGTTIKIVIFADDIRCGSEEFIF